MIGFVVRALMYVSREMRFSLVTDGALAIEVAPLHEMIHEHFVFTYS